ncbi:MAG: hypothetical protein NTW19_07760 [Planctomycetota bacterium]|nr:hypothetical protein [Planctomycetota bacterium]
METLRQIWDRTLEEGVEVYKASRFSALSRDCFSHFWRDDAAASRADETAIDAAWRIVIDAGPLGRRMGSHLAEFFAGPMRMPLACETRPADASAKHSSTNPGPRTILLLDRGGGDPATPETFTLTVEPDCVTLAGRDPEGLRDGVVKLVDLMGARCGPILPRGETVFRPRLAVRLGATPHLGSYREVVFNGFNAVYLAGIMHGGPLFALSTSDAIPELARRREPGALDAIAAQARRAKEYGLKTYLHLNTVKKFPQDDPVFRAHPEIRGALTWSADGEHVLCTEHPLVRRWLRESVQGLFRAAEALDGVSVIIGGEGFYHCFMRPFGVEKGHTNCPRCERVGAPAAVANLLNLLADAAREITPHAEVVAWPYSASAIWSVDPDQAPMIELMKPGTALLTEMEKEETVTTPEGIAKSLWDYSIQLVGPGRRAASQVAACKRAGIPIYVKSEPELSFEAPRLSHVPCLDRWLARAEAMASCGAQGGWVFAAFRPVFGSTVSEIYKQAWWTPTESADQSLDGVARRLAGSAGAPHLREAWRAVSEAIMHSPELPWYYHGPYYLGPCQPMIADPEAAVPEVFFGRYLFLAEAVDEEGMKLRPTFMTKPSGKEMFERAYRAMHEHLCRAAEAVDAAEPFVPAPARLLFDGEASAIRWFHHTARTHANFNESCRLRDQVLPLAKSADGAERAAAIPLLARWHEVLLDERENTRAALPIMEGDVRLDPYYGFDHSFSHGAEMIRAKLVILDHELDVFLPALVRRCGGLTP